jgi:surface protein
MQHANARVAPPVRPPYAQAVARRAAAAGEHGGARAAAAAAAAPRPAARPERASASGATLKVRRCMLNPTLRPVLTIERGWFLLSELTYDNKPLYVFAFDFNSRRCVAEAGRKGGKGGKHGWPGGHHKPVKKNKKVARCERKSDLLKRNNDLLTAQLNDALAAAAAAEKRCTADVSTTSATCPIIESLPVGMSNTDFRAAIDACLAEDPVYGNCCDTNRIRYGSLSSWSTGGIADMSIAFRGASAFNGDLSRWNTAKVTEMFAMFEGASALDADITGWRSTSLR